MIKKYDCYCDMGSMKILFEGGSCFISNGVGDVDFQVWVYENKEDLNSKFKFLEHFTSFGKAYLMRYDCSNEDSDKLHKFEAGRYFVYLDEKKTRFHIIKEDDEIHS